MGNLLTNSECESIPFDCIIFNKILHTKGYDYTVDCKKKCDQQVIQDSISSPISFINILNIPKQDSIGSKLFYINLNNVSTIILKEGHYISIEYYSFFPINFEFISLYIDDDIFPISSSLILKNEGYYKHNFLITSKTKLEPYSKIIFNLFIWDTNFPSESYSMQINANLKYV